MFTTILKEVGGFFDRRALTTVFFPSLVFWTGAALTVGLVEHKVDRAVRSWSHQPGLVQVGIVVGWTAFVVFWSLLWQAAGDAQDRFFQGYWPQDGPLSFLTRRGSRRHSRVRQRLIERDRELERKEIAAAAERAAFPDPQALSAPTVVRPPEDIDNELDALEACLGSRTSPDPLPGWGTRCRDLAEQLAPYSGSTQDPSWKSRLSRFAAAADQLGHALDEAELALREKRSTLHQQLFLSYPQPPVQPLPTRLGNVIRAAEQHPRIRYGLDPVVIWSRLQPVLPADYTDGVRRAKAGLDLLCTLAAYITLFGVPLAAWAAVRVDDPDRPALLWVALVSASLCAVGVSVTAHRTKLWLLALALLGVSSVPLVVTLVNPSTHLLDIPTVGLRLGLAALFCTEILTLSLIAYRGAVQAGIAFAEKVRTAFDLHRSRVLDQMRLRIPDDLAQERRTWTALCAFLYRGAPPDAGTLTYADPLPATATFTANIQVPADQPSQAG
ncbi:hypothetical protein SGFS_014910 [Streptomyces graminofaciens]|uniref:Integral membrane protein n=1 Tax=Streptomyces graminofaciens TaxID=68212 RepID=A0ABM7F3E1_9ACTN|nr:hypothetical protein [Streptomyces graminofaciens]BBC30197.1 hypothetical protein SGFS_014910 [Streptomyces graminofaciens]